MILKQKHIKKESVRNVIEQNGVYNEIKPWEIPRPIIDIAFTGYAYGSKRGQIRDMTDHNNIIPLYDYGVGTYDFDLEEVKSLVQLAQYKAQVAVKEYFENP